MVRRTSVGVDSARAEGALHELVETNGTEVHRFQRWKAVYLKEPDGYYRIRSLTTVLDSAR